MAPDLELDNPSRKITLKQALATDSQDTKTPTGFLAYSQKVFTFVGRSIGFLIAVALVSIFPIVMIVVGAVYLDQCPVQPYIPIYLIVAGVFGIIKSMLKIINQRRLNKLVLSTGDPLAKLSQTDPLVCFDSLVSTFIFIWVICGSVWVFRITFPNYTPPDLEPNNYCHRGLYLFAFIILIFFWICTGLFIAFCCCCGCLLCFGAGTLAIFGQNAKPESDPSPRAADPEQPISVRIVSPDTN